MVTEIIQSTIEILNSTLPLEDKEILTDLMMTVGESILEKNGKNTGLFYIVENEKLNMVCLCKITDFELPDSLKNRNDIVICWEKKKLHYKIIN